MVAALRFFQTREVLIHLLLRKEGCPVDALELGILFIAEQ